MACVSSPQWELSLLVVLEAFVTEPYEPLECSFMQEHTALTSAKRVSELTAVLVNPCCLLPQGDHSGATLRPDLCSQDFKVLL